MIALHLNRPPDGFILQDFHLKLTKNYIPIREAKTQTNKTSWQFQMLTRTWNNSHKLLVGMQNGTATLEKQFGNKNTCPYKNLYINAHKTL